MRFSKFVGVTLLVTLLMSGLGLASAQAQGYSASYKFLKAIKKVDYREIRVAIEKGVNINTRDYDDRTTALIISAKKKESSLVRYLLANGAKPNMYGEDGKTALVIAAGIGDNDMVAALMTSGADLDLADNNGTTPLIAAVLARKDRIVKILLDAGADYTLEDYSGRSPLQHAIDTRRRRTQKMLKKAGATS